MATEYKIAVIGTTKSGKSSYIASIFNKQFSGNYSPTIEEIYKEDYEFNDKKYKLTIFDTSGSEDYLLILEDMVQKFDGVIILLDKTQKNSLEELPKYIALNKEKKPMIIICNKSDIVKESIRGIENFGEYLDVSVQNKQNVSESFHKLLKMMDEKSVQNMKERRISMGISETPNEIKEIPFPKKRASSLFNNVEKRLSIKNIFNRKSMSHDTKNSQFNDLQNIIKEEDEKKKREEGKKKESPIPNEDKKEKRKTLKNLIDALKKK